MHAPHHVPKEYIERYKGKFDQGWDALREETFARQKQMGIIPPNAELTKRPKRGFAVPLAECLVRRQHVGGGLVTCVGPGMFVFVQQDQILRHRSSLRLWSARRAFHYTRRTGQSGIDKPGSERPDQPSRQAEPKCPAPSRSRRKCGRC
jgi:hypothetical protein